MKLKQLMAGATIAGALGAAALGAGAGVASAAPGPPPDPGANHGAPPAGNPRQSGGSRSGISMARGVPVDPHPVHRAILVVPGDPDRAVPVDPADTDPVAQADPETTDPAVPADLETTDPADPAAQADPADPVTTDPAVPAAQADPETTDPAVPVDRAVPAAHGMAMTSAATSTGPRGETDPHPGVPASHRGRHGTGRFRRPVDRGTTARSTTGATRKTRSGTRSSTSGASTSSESGSRCKELTSQDARFADWRSGRCPSGDPLTGAEQAVSTVLALSSPRVTEPRLYRGTSDQPLTPFP